jgi:alcohol dehydrogenase
VLGSIAEPLLMRKNVRFSVLVRVRPRMETVPLEKAYNVYNRLEPGDAKFRIGLTILRLDRASRLRPSTIW